MSASQADRLDSWKEIAIYLNRSVRTVRRWEATEGLPVHRHMHQSLGSVYAYKSEIDSWRQGESRRRAAQPTAAGRSADPASRLANSIAVLPFSNVSPDPDTEYFAAGLTDEVIADLSKVRALRVISRTSAMALTRMDKDVRTIGRELGVRYVVEGAVRRAGAKLRVSARLIDATVDEHLWAEKYDGSLENVFDIQERLARMIVGALEIRLTADEDRRLAERPMADVHAYECYLQARQAAFRWRQDAIDEAVRLLQNGLSIVGPNAELYAALGRAHLQYREAGLDFTDRPLDEADRYVQKVLALDPQSGVGAQLRGWVRYSRGQIREAVRDLEAARQADPANPDTLGLLSNCYLISGRVQVARALISELLAVDPLTPVTRCMPGWADVLEGRLEQALAPYRQMFEMDPGNPMARLFYVWVLTLNRRASEAAAIAESIPTEVQGSLPAQVTRFLAFAVLGEKARAVATLTPRVEVAGMATDVLPRFLAHGYALAGEPERALHWLTIAVDRGFINYPFIARFDPLLQPLRPRLDFQRLLETVRERWRRFDDEP
jgi:TolB-like protein/thioredoxin-like negative regulator of GroEL